MQIIYRIILSLLLALQLSLAGALPSHAHVSGELAGGEQIFSIKQADGTTAQTTLTKSSTSGSTINVAPNKGVTMIAPKIEKQMGNRGWDRTSLDETISKPHRTVTKRDTRHNPNTGSRNDDPATAYINSNGSYVVRNDKTGDIVQVSDRTDPNWKSPFE